MLFVLSGNIQTGKTRFLCDLLGKIAEAGTAPFGVVAPGVWRDEEGVVAISGGFECAEVDAFDWDGAPAGARDASGFEKLGICNTLVPGGETMLFAVRRDIAQAGGLIDEGAQSEKAQLYWYAFDDVIERENAHFATACKTGVLAAAGAAGDPAAGAAPTQALLVVDELGRMELLADTGLTEAVALLEAGPTADCPHALVVVREPLRHLVEERFGNKWNGYIGIYPEDEDGTACLMSTLRASVNA